MVNQLIGIMGWESSGVVRFDLRPLFEGQTRIVRLKMLITHLLLVLRFGMVNQPIGNSGLGIFWCGQI